MNAFKDCNENVIPIYALGSVEECVSVQGAKPSNSVKSLLLNVQCNKDSYPKAGQFFMLRASRSSHLLARPISVFHVERESSLIKIQFLILIKGGGTEELCSLNKGDCVELLGPLGNCFIPPYMLNDVLQSTKTQSIKNKVALIGGGIGVAPIAGFAETLPKNSYDFYASFKSGKYGLKNIKPAKLIVTTEDGSEGVCGMLPATFSCDVIQTRGYNAVYACGPIPMLKYVQAEAKKANVKCYISMESRMACGVGVCLGCTIKTTCGIKRCCKDGPVFDAEEIIFESQKKVLKEKTITHSKTSAPDLSFKIGSLYFSNPIIASSGTFGFATEYKDLFDVNRLGGIVSKGLTLEAREGNEGVRVWETPSGLMNSIGLQNPGIPHFIEYELPTMLSLKPVTIANLSGSTIESYIEGAKLLEKTKVPAIELNISCPNVSTGGAALGMSCESASDITSKIRAITKKPLIVKLTPQAADIVSIAMACKEAGADAVSLCNSFSGVAIDIEKGSPVFEKVKAGFGGPAIKPISLRLVYEVVQAMNTLPLAERIPVIGIGGIATWQDAVEFIMAGATAVQVGTSTFSNPFTMVNIIDGLLAFMKRKGYDSLEEMRGIAQ